MNRILLIGEQNPHGSDPRAALYPLPMRSSGGRLMRILGLSFHDYMRNNDRVNLCHDAWDDAEARAHAVKILEERPHGSGIVLLGRKAERAFGWVYPRYEVRLIEPGFHALALPHPSGLCRDWNDQENERRAREAYAALCARVGAE